MPNRAVPEALAVQKYWAETIVAGEERQIEFKGGRDIKVLRLGIPRKGSDVKKGICCVYFIKDNCHFLAMVSEKELDKMEDTLGTGRDTMLATNHAKTLCHGMKAAAKKMKWDEFKTVEACFGFWYDVDKDGELPKKGCGVADSKASTLSFHDAVITRTHTGLASILVCAYLGIISWVCSISYIPGTYYAINKCIQQ